MKKIKKLALPQVKPAAQTKPTLNPEDYIVLLKRHNYQRGVKAGKLSQYPMMAGVALASFAVGFVLPEIIRFGKEVAQKLSNLRK